jgi:tetratricopeptide (TPR) repeat protein
VIDAMKTPRAQLLFFYAAVIFLLNLPIAAQPGDETGMYVRAVADLKALDAKIAQRPNDADLYFQRGSGYLNLFNRNDLAEYQGVVYVTDPGLKALADFNRAIELDGSMSEYYRARGRFYDLQWEHSHSNEGAAAATSWEEIRRLNWDNQSFNSAVKDYQKALSVARKGSEMAHPLNLLASLYRARAVAVSFYAPAKTVRAEKQTRLVFDDFDRSLEFTRKFVEVMGKISEFTLSDIYQEKARAAIGFEEYAAGLKFLSDGIKEIEDRRAGTEGGCRLYSLRGDINQKLQDYDSAIRDYTSPIDHKYANCDAIYEKRGDAYSAKGNWQQAIDDYSIELKKYSYPNESLLTRRAKAYLKIGEAEKAIADLDKAMTWEKSCSELYQLRAEAYRMLNDENRAVEDEKTAAQFSRNKLVFCSP